MEKISLSLLFLFTSINAYSLPLNDAYVYAEDLGETEESCGLSNESAVSAVESVLRQNKIKIGNINSTYTAYINMMAINSGGNCISSISLESQLYGLATVDGIGKFITPISICNKQSLLTGPSYNLQTRANDALKTFTEQCISKIERIELLKKLK